MRKHLVDGRDAKVHGALNTLAEAQPADRQEAWRSIDRSLYPDVEEPGAPVEPGDRADYLARVCGAWDFGILPSRLTLRLLLGWRDVFDQYPVAASPAYHALRELFKWPRVQGAPPPPSPGEIDDAEAGRPPDRSF